MVAVRLTLREPVPHSSSMNVITQLTPKQLRRAADIQEKIIELQSELEQFLGVTPKVTPAVEEPPVRKR
jgi:hypothetical protein